MWKPNSWRLDAMPPYADLALALWRQGEPEEDVRRHYDDVVYERGLYGTP